jgi:cyclophilin family peptidyl-prolyl cis-trans isomerase
MNKIDSAKDYLVRTLDPPNKLMVLVFFLLVGIIFFIAYSGEEKEEDLAVINNNDKNMNYEITLKTNKGDIKFETYYDDAPRTVENFVKLAEEGFYDGVIFHRVIDGFMIQGGDPTGTGTGGPGYSFADEIDPESEIYQEGYKKGVVAMANAGPNTQGSQFFIMVADYPLPPNYTIFGKVVSGQEVADAISVVEKDGRDKPLQDVIIQEVVLEKK